MKTAKARGWLADVPAEDKPKLEKAEEIAKEQPGVENEWALTHHIYKNMGGKVKKKSFTESFRKISQKIKHRK